MCGLFGPLCLWLLTRSWPFPGVSLVTVGTDGCDKDLSLRLTSQWRVGGPRLLLTASSFPSRMLTTEEPTEPTETGRLEEVGGPGAHPEDTAVLSGEDSQAEQMLVSGPAGDGTGLFLSLPCSCPHPVPENSIEIALASCSRTSIFISPVGGPSAASPSAALCLGR